MTQSLAFWGQVQTGQQECLHLMTLMRQTCKHASVSTCCSKQASNASLRCDSQMLSSAYCFSTYQAQCVMHNESLQSAGIQDEDGAHEEKVYMLYLTCMCAAVC